MNIKKLLCIISLNHNDYTVLNSLCDENHMRVSTCCNCHQITKRPCRKSHCKCCNKHCNDKDTYRLPWDLDCKCGKCRAKHALPTLLWFVDKMEFLESYKRAVAYYGKDAANAAINEKEYDDIRNDIKKLLALL